MYKSLLLALVATLLFSCSNTYKDNYGPPVPPNTPPYSLNQTVKFENGQGDTITFKCTRHLNDEYVMTSPCSNDQRYCYDRDHYYQLFVDLTSSDNSRIFYLKGTSDGACLLNYINNTPNFVCSNKDGNTIPFLGPWNDSIVLNGKKFYDYMELGFITLDPYMDAIKYSRQDGIIMFSFRNQPMSLEERWVLVK